MSWHLILAIAISISISTSLSTNTFPSFDLNNNATINTAENYVDVSEYSSAIIKQIDYDYELIKSPYTIKTITDHYLKLLNSGKANGFTPVLIVPNDVLARYADIIFKSKEVAKLDSDDFLKKVESIDVSKLIRQRYIFEDDFDDTLQDITRSEFQSLEQVYFSEANTASSALPTEVIFLKIPTDKPWEIPLWISVSGYYAPNSEEQAAYFKYWYEQFRVYPACASFDMWEIYVANPPDNTISKNNLTKEYISFLGEEAYDYGYPSSESKFCLFWWD